ncbi:hypothetical protein [Cytobacillus sp. IB215316]|uniref:hypothetical protein n=1 Tax=Cytobacillus sp. IB215316 TaxID=3097354 RepID=UPI002A0EB5C4|nr:hypothetical protein [Cytobacillus sp. IB215316]MDX8360528.1 hypothetical protein [Cytobacillus sp. IB215316]
MKNIKDIIDFLRCQKIIEDGIEYIGINSGTTNAVLYILYLNKKPKYVVKIDKPYLISSTVEFLQIYKEVRLLPDVVYKDVNKGFAIYSYIPGETHNYLSCSKLEWMAILIKELFNKYRRVERRVKWGRIHGISRDSWSEFNIKSLEMAQSNIGVLLPYEEHKRVEILVDKLKTYENPEEKYYLHGDTGVHNFVYDRSELQGVIDPSPLIGPKIYDFTYAFCSSPDSLNLSTLLSSFALMTQDTPITKERLIDEFIFQLYTRIGVCIKVHAHDLSGYIEAWDKLKKYLPDIQ